MFCPKCGTKAIEGADFCQKCGARLIKDGPTSSVPVESSGSNVAPESTAAVQQPVDTARPSAVQEAYDRLTTTAASHPKIRQINIIGDPKSTSALLSVCGTLNEYFYSQNKKTGELRASRWSIKWIFYLICAPILICDVLFLMSFFRGEYSSPLLPIVCLIGCFIWFPFAFLIQKEREEVTVHIDRTLGWEIKRPSKIPMIVSYVLNLVEIGLCIFALVFVFSNSGDTPYHDDSPLNIDEPEENVALTQAYANEAEGISFMYPEGWTVTTGAGEVVSIAAPEGMFGSYANMSVLKDVADDMLFHYTASDFEQEYLSVDHVQDISKVSLTDMTIGGLPARKLEFSAVYDGADLIYFQYFYIVNTDAYVVSCTMWESSFDKYAPVFEAIMDSYTITPSPSTGASANGIQVNSMDDAQKLVENWMDAHPIGSMAGVDAGAAANDVDSISTEYFVLELWEAPREFLGLVYVRKFDGNITFKQFDFDDAISIDDWYEEWAKGQSANSAIDLYHEGVSLIGLLGCAPVELYNTLGAPTSGTPVNGEMYEGGEYYGYDGISFHIDFATNSIRWITAAPWAIDVNGNTLEQTRSGLVEMLGVPDSENSYHDELNDEDVYEIRYSFGGSELLIKMADINNIPYSILISSSDC